MSKDNIEMTEEECNNIARDIVDYAITRLDRKMIGHELPLVLTAALAAAMGAGIYLSSAGDKEKYEKIRAMALSISFKYIESYTNFEEVAHKVKEGQKLETSSDDLVF